VENLYLIKYLKPVLPDMYIVNNIFSQDEIDRLYMSVGNSESLIDYKLGRIQVSYLKDGLDSKTVSKLYKIVKDFTDSCLEIGNIVYVEYNPLYGKPNLPPHVDGDSTDLILNIQLASNTQWDLGLNLQTYSLKDNCALVFNPNKEIHWRVHKEFNDGEYVRMLFVRFANPNDFSDYSHLPHHPDDEMFVDIRAFRDSLKSNGI
jgi:hypothetical protein